jgi:hypothetical protein
MKLAQFVFCLLVFSTVLGCGSDNGRVKLYQVQGKVLVKGQPAEGARVVFYPTASEVGGKQMPTPAGETDSSGVYALESYGAKDGAPEGDYKVSVSWPEPPPANAQGIFDQKDRLAGRYSNPQTSKLTAHIEKGGGEVPAFDLQ